MIDLKQSAMDHIMLPYDPCKLTLKTIRHTLNASPISGLAWAVQMIAFKRTGMDRIMTGVDMIGFIGIYI